MNICFFFAHQNRKTINVFVRWKVISEFLLTVSKLLKYFREFAPFTYFITIKWLFSFEIFNKLKRFSLAVGPKRDTREWLSKAIIPKQSAGYIEGYMDLICWNSFVSRSNKAHSLSIKFRYIQFSLPQNTSNNRQNMPSKRNHVPCGFPWNKQWFSLYIDKQNTTSFFVWFERAIRKNKTS